jgi:hypothetical protein
MSGIPSCWRFSKVAFQSEIIDDIEDLSLPPCPPASPRLALERADRWGGLPGRAKSDFVSLSGMCLNCSDRSGM